MEARGSEGGAQPWLSGQFYSSLSYKMVTNENLCAARSEITNSNKQTNMWISRCPEMSFVRYREVGKLHF